MTQHPPASDRERRDEMRDFALAVREGLLVIVRYIEKRYSLGSKN
jgi:hypothetical protein